MHTFNILGPLYSRRTCVSSFCFLYKIELFNDYHYGRWRLMIARMNVITKYTISLIHRLTNNKLESYVVLLYYADTTILLVNTTWIPRPLLLLLLLYYYSTSRSVVLPVIYIFFEKLCLFTIFVVVGCSWLVLFVVVSSRAVPARRTSSNIRI